ncbi:MAG: o-succinylbenzoate--CoA ligase [Chlorobi bacterium]|nr:o-succinylbenzoate--CoA ligase [Chlorobiota bacterium]
MNSILGDIDKANIPAIITESKNIDYPEMTRLINNTAAKYLSDGVMPKNRIAIISENSFEFVITVYALWRLNAVPVLLNIRLTEDELSRQIDFAECSVLLKSKRYSNYLTKYPSQLSSVEYSDRAINYENETNGNDTAVILFTSGSSGKPKGVEITNSNLFESYLSITSEYSFTSADRFLASLPFYHIGGFSIITRAILSGGTLIIPISLKTDVIAESLQKYEPTVISLVPTMLKRLIEKKVQPNKNLRLAFVGGGPSDDDLVITAINLGWSFVKVYGSTETSSMISGINDEKLREKPASGGKAFKNVEIKILNDSYEEVEPFEVGEIAVKSKSIVKGYLKNPELWNTKIHNGYYLTGDWGYIDDEGYLFVVSRRTDLIISGGENIDPAEIEKVLISHPAVNEAIVFPLPDKEWGQIPVAAIVIKNNEKLSEREIQEYLKDHLSSYKLPKKIFFMEKLPRTDLGKIDLPLLKRKLNLD